MIARVSIALVCLTGVLCLAAPAGARTGWLPIFEHEAVAYWGHGAPPACGPIRYQWVDDATMRADHADIGYTPNADADAGANCLIRFGVNAWHHMSTPLKCLTVAHEIGHIYGRAHNDRPDSVMYEGGIELIEPEWWVVPPCRDSMLLLKRRSPRGFVWRALRPRPTS